MPKKHVFVLIFFIDIAIFMLYTLYIMGL